MERLLRKEKISKLVELAVRMHDKNIDRPMIEIKLGLNLKTLSIATLQKKTNEELSVLLALFTIIEKMPFVANIIVRDFEPKYATAELLRATANVIENDSI